MRTFKDSGGRAWKIDITVAQVKRVRAELKLDLLGLVDDRLQPLERLLADPVTLVDLIYVLCSEQADKDGVTDEQFGRAMAGDAIEAAAEAFVGALSDFFPSRQREALRAVVAKQKELKDVLAAKGMEELKGMDLEKAAEEILKEIRKTTGPGGPASRPQSPPGVSSTDARASAASTPTP
jgi:hypothetical protein